MDGSDHIFTTIHVYTCWISQDLALTLWDLYLERHISMQKNRIERRLMDGFDCIFTTKHVYTCWISQDWSIWFSVNSWDLCLERHISMQKTRIEMRLIETRFLHQSTVLYDNGYNVLAYCGDIVVPCEKLYTSRAYGTLYPSLCD